MSGDTSMMPDFKARSHRKMLRISGAVHLAWAFAATAFLPTQGAFTASLLLLTLYVKVAKSSLVWLWEADKPRPTPGMDAAIGAFFLALTGMSPAALVLGLLGHARRMRGEATSGVGQLLLGLVAAMYIATLYGTFVRTRRARLVEKQVSIEGLPEELEGLCIAHLSDLHIGAFTPEQRGHEWVQLANDQRPDLAVFTGDYVTSGTGYHREIARVLCGAKARLGTYAVLGNHDYYGDAEPLATLLSGGGVHLLRNAGHSPIPPLLVAGVEDPYGGKPSLDDAFSEAKNGQFKLLLAHNPNFLARAADRETNLVLSGHTHAGQVAMPFLVRWLNLARISYRQTYGFYRQGRTLQYVHAGLGTTGPPMRFGAAPEVVILTLRAA